MQLCGFPAYGRLRDKLRYRLNAPENSSFPQKAIYSVTIFLLFYFYSSIRYSVNMLKDATRFLNETTTFTRRERDASLQGTGILERLLLRTSSRESASRVDANRGSVSLDAITRTRFYPSYRVTARTQFARTIRCRIAASIAARVISLNAPRASIAVRARFANRDTLNRDRELRRTDKIQRFGSTVISVNEASPL